MPSIPVSAGSGIHKSASMLSMNLSGMRSGSNDVDVLMLIDQLGDGSISLLSQCVVEWRGDDVSNRMVSHMIEKIAMRRGSDDVINSKLNGCCSPRSPHISIPSVPLCPGTIESPHEIPMINNLSYKFIHDEMMLDDIDFDAFTFERIISHDMFVVTSLHFFISCGLHHIIHPSPISMIKFIRFMQIIQSSYHIINPYHNSKHAVDVTVSFMSLLRQCSIISYCTPWELVACIIACLCHDAGMSYHII